MLEIQFLQFELLKRHLGKRGILLNSVVVFDKVQPQYWEMAKALPFDQIFMPDQLTGRTGIRRPTMFCISHLVSDNRRVDSYLLRCIQDTFISDIHVLSDGIIECLDVPYRLAGAFAATNNLSPYLEMLGLRPSEQYEYVQGALMFGHLSLWRAFYLQMPEQVVHFFDDSVMSQWLYQSGGRFHRLAGFIHLHGADNATLEQIRQSIFDIKSATLCELSSIFRYPATDKGTVHSYLGEYDRLFLPFRNLPVCILELGVGTGGSLSLWARYFWHEDSEIIGVDLNAQGLSSNDKRIAVYHGDATCDEFLTSIPGNFDIVIDDASHDPRDQLRSFFLLRNRLRPGGLYIIEDLQSSDAVKHICLNVDGFQVIDLRAVKGRYDDVLMLYRSAA